MTMTKRRRLGVKKLSFMTTQTCLDEIATSLAAQTAVIVLIG